MLVCARRGIRGLTHFREAATLIRNATPTALFTQQSTAAAVQRPNPQGSMACSGGSCKHGDDLSEVIKANRLWAAEMQEKDPDFFNRLVEQQSPEYLWIGCSDSRVPANQILNMAPGEIFVQRNVGNQAMHTDLNLMSCLEYAVKALKVKSIMVTGHYNCGAVKAALQLPHATSSLVNCWISDIRECRNQAERELLGLDPEQQLARLCELNVLRQVFHVATSPVVASAWAEGQELHVYGLIYDVADGHLRKLAGPISGDDGYEHRLESFVSGGVSVTRCPTTQKLRVSGAAASSGGGSEDAGADAALQLGGARGGSSNGAGAAAAACGIAGPRRAMSSDAGSLGDVPTYASLATPSELMSSINSINLAESIAKHKQWASPAAVVPAGGGASGAPSPSGAGGKGGDTAPLSPLAAC